MDDRGYLHHWEFVLAHLQKAQSSDRGEIDLLTTRLSSRSAEPGFRNLAQQKIAEHADPF
jgi:hypothetical protein